MQVPKAFARLLDKGDSRCGWCSLTIKPNDNGVKIEWWSENRKGVYCSSACRSFALVGEPPAKTDIERRVQAARRAEGGWNGA